MNRSILGKKFDSFSLDVIDRLARIETQHDLVIARLDTLNGSVADHAAHIAEHEKKFARFRGASSVIAAMVASAMSVILPRLRVWFHF